MNDNSCDDVVRSRFATGQNAPGLVFFSGVIALMLAKVIKPADFLHSLSSESIITVFLLIFITAGIKNHFNLIGFLNKLFRSAGSSRASWSG